MKTYKYLWDLFRFIPGQYTLMGLIRLLAFSVAFHVFGLIIRAIFNTLSGNAQVDGLLDLSIWTLCALLVATALARVAAIFVDNGILHFNSMFTIGTLLRKNLLEYILGRPGAQALPHSSGEAISRFRDDVDEVTRFMSWLPFLSGHVAFAAFAIFVMIRINLPITLVVFTPLVGVVVVFNLTMRRIQKYRRANREATGEVTGFIGEMFASAQAIKVATAEEHMIDRFEDLNDARQTVTLKDRMLNQLLVSVFRNVVHLGIGVTLILAGQAMQEGTFTVGDFALFVYYLEIITEILFALGSILSQYKQTGVSIERIVKLLGDAPSETLVRHSPVYIHGNLPEVPHVHKTDADLLLRLEATALTYRYPESDNGIERINLGLERGSFTVITGRVGSGKTTLLRVLLGLLPKGSGEISWNGETIADPASFLLPPRTAYTSQVPRLFSETLRDNILMGLPEDEVDLQTAIRSAVMEKDIEELENGLDTVVGPRGVKLSGGQIQRGAAARMFVHDAELLVFDDLSSALDVETEGTLWGRLFSERETSDPPTCLVVSHRRTALRRADHIIVLKDGKVEDEGALDELLESCEEMVRLWKGDPSLLSE